MQNQLLFDTQMKTALKALIIKIYCNDLLLIFMGICTDDEPNDEWQQLQVITLKI